MKTKLILITLGFFSQLCFAQYDINPNQLYPVETGKIISSETTSYFGNSIDFSANGSVLAVGEYGYGTATRVSSGRVRVYLNETGSWVQKGQDLVGIEDSFNAFGKKVELSSDGNTLAVYDAQIGVQLNTGETLEDKYGDLAPEYFPYIQVYQFDNGTWTKIGSDFLINDFLDTIDISLSGNGMSLAIASKTGTKIYDLNSGTWSQSGQEILANDELYDEKISLSNDGKTLIIGNPFYSDPNSTGQFSYEGQVKVYRNTSNIWTQTGNSINGTDYLGYLGSKVSVSSDGQTIAIGTAQSTNNDYVAVLEFVGNNWISKGTNITQVGSTKIISMQLSDDGNAIVIGEELNTRVLKYSSGWEQVNLAFESDDTIDELGYSVTISGDGNLYAAGAPSIGTSARNGYVSVFTHNKNSLTRFGDEVYGNAERDYLGNSVSVSQNGKVIAVGASGQYQDESLSRVMVYEKTIDGLVQIGEDILKPSTDTYSDFGSVVELSANGSLLAISAPLLYNSNYGAVYIYQRNGSAWVRLGNTITGTYGARTGSSLSFSKDGTILAVGSGGNSGGVSEDQYTGYTTVYKFNNSNTTWEVLGERINGEAVWDFSGGSVHLSGDGTILAVGAIGNDGETVSGGHGHVRVFKYNNSSWEQMGADVDGNPDFNIDFGGVVKLSKDGSTLIVSDINSQSLAGSVELFNWDEGSSNWISEIRLKSFTSSGTNNGHRFEFGKDISLSDDGNILAIGEYKWQELSNTTDGRGKVYIYIKSETGWTESELFLEGRHKRQYLGEAVSLSGNGNTLVVGSYNYGSYDVDVNSYAGMATVYQLNLCSSLDSFNVFDEPTEPLTLIPDTNFEQYLIDENIDSDNTINGQVLTADIENITQVIVNDKNISNLTGIQDFTSLVELSATNNQITTIDLSKNVLLEKLFIANNHLSSLNISNNIKLKNLDVGENSLSILDVHQLIDLETLSCYKNQLTTINLISNKKLLSFIANDNQLKFLDIRENTALFWLDLDDNLLEDLMLKNENNSKIIIFSVTGNPNLTCIEVDDVSFSDSNWANKDDTANYSIDCAPVNDDCSKSIPLTFGQLTPGDVISGTTENTNPSCAVGDVFTDVWYTVVVPSTGEFSVEGFSPIGTVKFAIYQSCASISAIACGTSISLKNLEVGTPFYLRVWLETDNSKSAEIQSNTGLFSLTVSESSVLSDADFTKINNELMVYPNPSSSFINIKMLDNSLLETIEIYNLIGEKVLIKSFDNLINVQLNISHLSKGVYFMKAKSNNKITSKKLIIN